MSGMGGFCIKSRKASRQLYLGTAIGKNVCEPNNDFQMLVASIKLAATIRICWELPHVQVPNQQKCWWPRVNLGMVKILKQGQSATNFIRSSSTTGKYWVVINSPLKEQSTPNRKVWYLLLQGIKNDAKEPTATKRFTMYCEFLSINVYVCII